MIAIETLTFACPSCNFLISDEPFQPNGIVCPRCNSRIEPSLFPALLLQKQSHQHQMVIADEAACYFHADRVATFACSRCGRFLCPLCRIAWPGEDICAPCLEVATAGKQATQLASNRFHFDSLALTLSTAPILGGFISILTAPIALGFALFTFRKECSVAPRGKIRFLLAILCSAATIAGWALFFVYVFRRNMISRPPDLQ